MEREKMIKANDIAEIMGVSKQTVSNWVREGMPTESTKPLRFFWSKCKIWIKERGK
jgi:phage terminase Nu1 subunit (DNA packaging protein)